MSDSDIRTIFRLICLSLVGMACIVAAPFVAFAVKAGWLRVPVSDNPNVFKMAFFAVILSAAFVIVLIVMTVFWHLGIATFYAPLVPVFVEYYKLPGCHICEISAWWHMLGEAWPYFLATTVTLFTRAWADRNRLRKSPEEFGYFPRIRITEWLIPPIMACVAYLFFLYGEEIISQFQRFGFANAVLVFFHRWLQEIASLADPIIAMRNGQSFEGWLQSEIAKLHVSLFKLSALYPKLFWVFILFEMIPTIRKA